MSKPDDDDKTGRPQHPSHPNHPLGKEHGFDKEKEEKAVKPAEDDAPPVTPDPNAPQP